MTMESLPDPVEKQLELADENISDAQYLLEGGRLKATVNRAYYAMFHGSLAALAHVGVESPRTHSGTIQFFRRHIANTGMIEAEFVRYLQDAFDLRQQSDYQVYTSVDEEQAAEIVARAEAFVEEIKRLIEGEVS